MMYIWLLNHCLHSCLNILVFKLMPYMLIKYCSYVSSYLYLSHPSLRTICYKLPHSTISIKGQSLTTTTISGSPIPTSAVVSSATTFEITDNLKQLIRTLVDNGTNAESVHNLIHSTVAFIRLSKKSVN